MSTPLTRYVPRVGDMVPSQQQTLGTFYLAADVDALLRQREEEELAKAYQRANIAEANQRQLAGTVKEVHTLRAQLATTQARIEKLEKRWHDACAHDYDIDLLAQVEASQQQLATMTAELEEYRYMAERAGATKAVSQLADCQQQLATMTARRAQVEEALREIADMLTEINPDNYDQDDVEAQNSSVIGAVNYARQFLTPTERPPA